MRLVGIHRMVRQAACGEVGDLADGVEGLMFDRRRGEAADMRRGDDLRMGGEVGRRLAQSGLMAALTAADGRILEANAAFHGRAGGEAEISPGTPLVDLLVMGAYGHSRFRESLLGGVTRTVLESMNLPVLMAH